jgi:hypothetical protein
VVIRYVGLCGVDAGVDIGYIPVFQTSGFPQLFSSVGASGYCELRAEFVQGR